MKSEPFMIQSAMCVFAADEKIARHSNHNNRVLCGYCIMRTPVCVKETPIHSGDTVLAVNLTFCFVAKSRLKILQNRG